MATAKKATLSDAKVKVLVWGEPGSGKSRFALSAPKPLVIDTEQSTNLYANEFDFMLAQVDKSKESEVRDNVSLTKTILSEFSKKDYEDIETLVIDNITDVLDTLERSLTKGYEEKILKNKPISDLNKLEISKWYSYRKNCSRIFLDEIKANPTHVVFTGRSKLEWGKVSGSMQPTGNMLFDGLEIVESLMDVVIQLKKEKGEIKAIVKKSRLANLPDELPIKDFSTILDAIKGILPEETKELEEEKSE